MDKKKIHFRGARKTSVASCYIKKEQTQELMVNKKDYREYFRVEKFITMINTFVMPHLISKNICLSVKVVGGGLSSQVQSVVNSSLKCLMYNFEDLLTLKSEPTYKKVIKHDPRNKWRNTIGSQGANRSKQSRKR